MRFRLLLNSFCLKFTIIVFCNDTKNYNFKISHRQTGFIICYDLNT